VPFGLSLRLPFGLRIGGGALNLISRIARHISPRDSGSGARLCVETRRRLLADEDFYRSVRPWLLLRGEDSVLIVPPNRVYKLGGSAFGVASWLDGGGRLADIPGLDEGRALELGRFFDELRAAYAGKEPEGGFARIRYGFDFTRLPVLGEVALTYRCNERCRFCYAACGDSPCRSIPGGEGNELSTDEWKRIIRMLKDSAKIPFFSFTGGEPLLRLDLEELASYAKSLGLRTNLITNGSLASVARAASIKAAGIDTAQVSLESPDPSIHDALCGVDGAWKRTLAGIEALKGAGVSVQTNSTITRANAASLESLPSLLKKLGIGRFSMNLFIPSGRGLDNGDLFLTYSEVGRVVDSVRRRAHGEGLTFLWYSPTPYCIYNPVARGLGNKSCAAADGLIHVDPRGEILPCSSWAESLGAPLTSSFESIWFSERASFMKNKRFAPAECEACASFAACQGACPLYWEYAGTDELRNRAEGGVALKSDAPRGVAVGGTA
jgi:radical SAM protein with 4Fe4S-binding SPASM domain